nr:EOG090X06YP [Triops cancriformis]
MFWPTFIAFSCVKALFIPAYRSTDFEVHRNWLAITSSLSLEKWYVEDTSPWTLDYPPLFAWFEYLLGFVAKHVDPAMLNVTNLDYASSRTILFQRLSVIVTDIVYAFGVREYTSIILRESTKSREGPYILAILLLCNVGLFIVDHIHFQYNGFLSGILLLAMGSIMQGKHVRGAFWFAILLNLKHIYLYIAPAFFVYLLRNYCLETRSFSFKRFATLGLVVVSVFAASFGPFVYNGQLSQVLSRLFPFKRGLSHAYWAPNIWALYNGLDKVLTAVWKQQGWLEKNVTAAMTGGLVQEFEHVVLPSIPPFVTFVLTALAMLPSAIFLWRAPKNPRMFVKAVVACAFASFFFGWHVHEKAVLLIILPMTILAVHSAKDCLTWMITSVTGHVSLFPLLFTPFETPVKICAVLLYSVTSYSLLVFLHQTKKPFTGRLTISPLLKAYWAGLSLVALYEAVGYKFNPGHSRMPFLPLLIMSVYCALGLLYSWLQFLWQMALNDTSVKSRKVE